MFRRPEKPAVQRPAAPADTGIEFAWRVHTAIQGWTSSVDAKASVVLVAETAVTGVALKALVTPRGELHHVTGLNLAIAISAAVLLVAAVAAALAVVFPRLKRRRTKRRAKTGLIYFGHLRHRSSAEIERALKTLTPDEERRQLASQLWSTSDVAWRKHAALQLSAALFGLGALLLIVAFLAF